MAGFTEAEANRLIDGYLSDGTYSTPTDVWLALFRSDPTISNEEADYGGYARVKVTGQFSTASNGSSHNTSPIIFPEDTDGNSGNDIYYVALCNSDTVGDASSIIISAVLAEHITPESNQSIVFNAGDLLITLR